MWKTGLNFRLTTPHHLDFFSELKRRCFPSMTQEKIHCRELFCMHLGALPVSQAADHASRLAAKLGGTMMIPLLL